MHTTLSLLTDVLAAAPRAAPKTLPEVISGIQGWIMVILPAVATMFFVIGGLRYMTAGGDPAQVEQAKGNFKSAVGYALVVEILMGFPRRVRRCRTRRTPAIPAPVLSPPGGVPRRTTDPHAATH